MNRRQIGQRDIQYAKFSAYGFLKNLRFFEPFLVLYLLDVGLNYAQIGALYAVREVAINVLEVPTGVLADAFGRRRTMVASFGAYIGAFVIFFVASGFWLVLAAMVLFAAGEALRSGTHKAMIMAHLVATGRSAEKGRYYGRTRSWSQIGSAVSALVGASIVFVAIGYRRVFLFSVVPYVLDLVLILSYPISLDGPRRPVSISEMRSAFSSILSAIGLAARKPRLGRLFGNAALLEGLYAAAKDFLQPILVATALLLPVLQTSPAEQRSAFVVGLAYAVLYSATSVASRRSADVAGWFGGPRRAVNLQLAAGGIILVGVGLLAFGGADPVAVVLFFGLFVLHNLRRPVIVSLVSDCVAAEVQATAMSVEAQLKTVFTAAFAFAIGVIADAAGGNVSVGLAIVGLTTLLILPTVWIRRNDAEVLGCPVD